MVSRTSDEHSQSSVEASTPHDAEKQENQHVINQSALPSGHGTEQSKEELEKDTNLIELEGPDDPINPQLMSNGKKWFLCAVLGCMTLVVTFASSVFSTATQVVAAEYHVGLITSTLGTGLFVFGFSAGPILFGPMSEVYGRKNPLFAGYVCFLIFQIPVAVARNLETIMLCRFLGGVAAAGPPSIVGGYLADFFDPVNRGLAVAVFSAMTLVGPILGPIIGGFITQSYLGWRWTAWITMIMSALFGLVGFVTLPETYLRVLLHRKARKIRFETQNWAIHAKYDESPVDLKSILVRYLNRPFVMLVLEPILLITLYMAFIYGFIYLLFEAYPSSFIDQRHWNLGVGGLPFIAVGVGVALGSVYIAYVTKTRIKRTFQQSGKIRPEDRLIPMMVGGVLLPVGCFWFGWTSSPHINPWPQIIAGVPIGASIQILFLQGLAYLIDVYLINANSVISANVMIRSLVGGAFPMAAVPMYQNLGVPWASSTLGFIAIAFFPVPILFYIFGERIRRMSRWSPTAT